MRVFVALPAPDAVADRLDRWVQAHRDLIKFRKWTHPHDYHITLQFLGEMENSRLGELDSALRHVRAATFELSLSGGGTFGAASSPRVLWARLSGDMERLRELHRSIVQATGPLGYVPEDRPYAGHITVARNFIGHNAGQLKEAAATMPSNIRWTADRFVLMRTHLHAAPMYETIGEYRL